MSKTVLELTPQEWQRYHPAQVMARRKREQQPQIEQRKQRAWRVARQAAKLLRKEFGAEKVVLFGSLSHEAWFTPWSDIDLATWGIPADQFYRAVGKIAEFNDEFRIDLVDPENVPPSLQEEIESEGRPL